MDADQRHGRVAIRELWSDRIGQAGTRALQVLLILALGVVLVFALIQLKLVVIPVLVALIVAAALAPVIRWLRRFMSPMLATWITLLGGVVIFGGAVTLIVMAVRSQWDELASSALDGVDRLQEFVTNGPIPVDAAQVQQAKDAILGFLTSSQFGSGALAGVSVAADLITGALLAIVILFFFLKDGDRIWNFFLRPFRGRSLERGHRVGRTSVWVLGSYVRGTALIALVDAAGIGIGLAVLQVPLALPLAVIVFISSFVPIVGATVAGILAALVALVANGPIVALIVIAIVIAVNQIEGNFLQPIVQARGLKLHALVILLALAAGTVLGGLVGAVLSVPIAAVAWAVYKNWNPPGEDAPPFAEPTAEEKAEDAATELKRTARKTARSGRRGRSAALTE